MAGLGNFDGMANVATRALFFGCIAGVGAFVGCPAVHLAGAAIYGAAFALTHFVVEPLLGNALMPRSSEAKTWVLALTLFTGAIAGWCVAVVLGVAITFKVALLIGIAAIPLSFVLTIFFGTGIHIRWST